MESSTAQTEHETMLWKVRKLHEDWEALKLQLDRKTQPELGKVSALAGLVKKTASTPFPHGKRHPTRVLYSKATTPTVQEKPSNYESLLRKCKVFHQELAEALQPMPKGRLLAFGER